MGIQTRATIVSEGQLLAGRDDMATQANTWLQRWLDSVAASWPWPQLHAEAVAVPLAAGTSPITVGGASPITQKVLRILDNVWLYDTNRTFRQRVRIRHWLGSPVDRIGDTTNIGKPTAIRVTPTTTFGQWTLYFEPYPDTSYLLTMPYIFLPDPLTLDTQIPWYPNDETMVQAVAFKVSEYHNGKDSPVTAAFQQQLAVMVSNDRVRYGSVNGINDSLILNPAVFKPKRTDR